MKGRTAKGSVPNAGTMNVFQYKALLGLDEAFPNSYRFSTYSVTEDKASEIEYFSKGYYSIYHPYVVSSGTPATNISKEIDRLLRWARGNFVVFLRKNPLRRHNNLETMHRIWAIEGTLYPINGLITVIFYFAALIYVSFGVTFLTFADIAILVLFLGLMLCGRIAYLLSVPTISQEDMWANMQGWLNVMPIYVWSVLSYHKGYAKNAAWVSTGSGSTSDGARLQWVIVIMQALNIMAILIGIGMMLGDNYLSMWTFFARMGLGIMLFVMQIDLVKIILEENKIINKGVRLGPVVTFTLCIAAGLIFSVGWEFDVAPPTN